MGSRVILGIIGVVVCSAVLACADGVALTGSIASETPPARFLMTYCGGGNQIVAPPADDQGATASRRSRVATAVNTLGRPASAPQYVAAHRPGAGCVGASALRPGH